MRGLGFAKSCEIILVDNRRSRVHPGWHRSSGRSSPILEIVNRIVVQIVQKLQPIISHHVRLLNDRGGDGAALNPLKSFRVLVKRDYGNLAREIDAMKRIGGARAS